MFTTMNSCWVPHASDVHETFQAETETRPEMRRSETETRPRRWAFWSRRDPETKMRRDVDTSRDGDVETETTSLLIRPSLMTMMLCVALPWPHCICPLTDRWSSLSSEFGFPGLDGCSTMVPVLHSDFDGCDQAHLLTGTFSRCKSPVFLCHISDDNLIQFNSVQCNKFGSRKWDLGRYLSLNF